jgi:hypothetical protein
LTPYPEFGSITQAVDTGRSNYHALQLEVKKQFSAGYSVGLSYTYSRLMDQVSYLNPTDPLPWYGVSTYDRPQRIALNSLFDLPIGRGKLVGSNMSKWADYIAGGWKWNAIFTFQSGDPLTWGNVLYQGDTGRIRLSADNRTLDHWFNTSGFVTASTQQLADNIRTFPLRLSNVRGDAQNLWEFAAIKAIPIHERLNIQLRGEAYNALNHPSMSDPNVNPTSSAFGQVSSQNGYARQIDLAVRILF